MKPSRIVVLVLAGALGMCRDEDDDDFPPDGRYTLRPGGELRRLDFDDTGWEPVWLAVDYDGDGERELIIQDDVGGAEVLPDGSMRRLWNLRARFHGAAAVPAMPAHGASFVLLRMDGVTPVDCSTLDSEPACVTRPGHAASGSPLAVAAADLDEDGVADLVVRAGSYVTLRRGKLDGGEVDWPDREAVPILLGGRNDWSQIAPDDGVFAGDLDADSHVDIVVADTIAFGDGTGAWSDVAALTASRFVHVADFDGDGRLDVMSEDGLLLNLGGRRFASRHLAHGEPRAIGRFEPGGTQVVDFGVGELRIHAIVDGEWTTRSLEVTRGLGPFGLIVIDHDRDGRDELLFEHEAPSTFGCFE